MRLMMSRQHGVSCQRHSLSTALSQHYTAIERLCMGSPMFSGVAGFVSSRLALCAFH